MLRLFVSEKKLLLLVHSKGANKNVIHKAHRRIQFIRQQKKLWYFRKIYSRPSWKEISKYKENFWIML